MNTVVSGLTQRLLAALADLAGRLAFVAYTIAS